MFSAGRPELLHHAENHRSAGNVLLGLPAPANGEQRCHVQLAMNAYRIALVSDIHGNELALSRVLQDIRRRGVDQIACLGDVARAAPALSR